MRILDIILLLIGAVCFGIAAMGKPVGRVNLIALGLLAWILVPLIGLLQH
jgi:hypothetical protein